MRQKSVDSMKEGFLFWKITIHISSDQGKTQWTFLYFNMPGILFIFCFQLCVCWDTGSVQTFFHVSDRRITSSAEGWLNFTSRGLTNHLQSSWNALQSKRKQVRRLHLSLSHRGSFSAGFPSWKEGKINVSQRVFISGITRFFLQNKA